MNVHRASPLALLLVAPFAHAAEGPDQRDKVLPCRPTIACTADITAAGTSEIEAGALCRRVDDSGRQWTFPLLTKLSLSRVVQLQVGTNGYSIARGRVPAQYLDDVTVGPKLHLVDQAAYVPSFALSAAASIPTFRRSGYERTYDALFTAYVTKDFGWLHADLNFGLNVWRVEDAPKKQPFVALALSVPLPGPFGFMVEGYVFGDAAPVATRDGGLLFAISHAPTPWLMFDFGGDVGACPSTRAYSLFVGMTIVPVVFFRRGVAS